MFDNQNQIQITGTARSIRELFTSRKYGIEYYQREYAWSTENVQELIDDLVNAFQRSFDPKHERRDVSRYQPYFLGPIVISKVGGERFVVDGQQRLTTLTLLLIYLQHLGRQIDSMENLENLIKSQKFGAITFNLHVDEREEVMYAIFTGTDFDPAGASESVANIWQRYHDLVEVFPEEITGSVLPYFSDWLLENVVIVEIETTDKNMALEVFETMNDRGLNLSSSDMLKSFLLSEIRDDNKIRVANDLWRRRMVELNDASDSKTGDAEFLKVWLRAKYAETRRLQKKDAAPGDFDIIGTAFHKWVRDNRALVRLNSAADFERFVHHEFNRMSKKYLKLIEVSQKLEPGWEYVFYNAQAGVTLQYLPILAATNADDDDETFRKKTELVAAFIDILIARRMVNFRNIGYSTLLGSLFILAKDLRDQSIEQVREILADRIANLEETFEVASVYGLTQRNRTHIHYLLARITSWLELQTTGVNNFAEFMDSRSRDRYEVEHIWADKYERYTHEFADESEFSEVRNRFGGLLLLRKSFNASYGAKPYEQKLEHYITHNMLAKSLNAQAYKNNPRFIRLINETGLPFEPHERFSRQELTKRQNLYQDLLQVVWNPDAVGLGGGERTKLRSQTERRAFYRVTTTDLIHAKILGPNEELVAERSGITYKARMTPSGMVAVDGSGDSNSLSSAAKAVTKKEENGWTFWGVRRGNEIVSLATLREQYFQREASGTDI